MARRKPNQTKLEIIQAGTHMFLEKGYTNTSIKAISDDLDISTGNLTFHFPTKEHLLLELVKELVSFHSQSILNVREQGYSDLLAYCWEITAQIVMCEDNPQAKDLYLAIYTQPMTLAYVKDWTAEKNIKILGSRLPDWTEERFRMVENVTCCIERSALTEPCTESYTLEDKIALTLDSLLKIYDVSKEEREETIREVLRTDYHKAGHDIFIGLTEYAEQHNQKALDDIFGR